MKRLKHHKSVDTKRCSACQDVKTLDDFDRNRSRPDGFDNLCRSCRKDYRAELKQAKLEATGPWVQFNGQWHLYSGDAAWADAHGLILVHGKRPDAYQVTTAAAAVRTQAGPVRPAGEAELQ